MREPDNGNQQAIESTPQSLAELTAQFRTLQSKLSAVHTQQQDLYQELQAIKAGQIVQTEKIEQIRLELLRGRWWRRFGAGIRFLIIAAVIGAVLYFVVNWQALLLWFV